MALSPLVQNFRWVNITPETMPAFPTLPTNLATKADLATAKAELSFDLQTTKTELTSDISTQTAAIGDRLISAVNAEQLVNDAIEASIVLSAAELLAAQNTNFATLNGRIDNVATSVTNVAGSVSVLSDNVTLVDGKVTLVDSKVTTVQGDLTAAKTKLDAAVVSNDNQDLALDELVRGIVNLGEVATTLLGSIN